MSEVSQRILYGIRLLGEWQAWLGCFFAGAAMALAFAPFDCVWVALLALPAFYLLLEAAAARRHAILRGFFFGYGYCIAGTWWIANALTVDLEKFGWLIPLSVLGLSAVMALWFAVLGLMFWWRRSGCGIADILRFIALWLVVEYLRSFGMFGFPWNLLGYAVLPIGPLSQLAAYGGVYSLSLLVLAVALLPVVWLKTSLGERTRGAYSAVVLIAVIILYGLGMVRIPPQTGMTATRVRVVQPNIAQSMKWTQAGRLESLRIHEKLSRLRTEAPIPPIIVWSETAFAFTLYPDSVWPSRLAALLPPRSTLLTGAVRADDSGPRLRIWNSMLAIDPQGQLRAAYDKHQLVPFGEFVPLRQWLPLEKITPGDTDFSRGSGPQTLAFGDVPPFSALVCYEVIFPGIAASATARPDWIVNVTNDAWYGDSPGPYQHYAMARMRAIEQGLPVVRAANTGISGVIDPYGRTLRSLPLNERGIIDQALPRPLPPTLYSRYAERGMWFAIAVLWAMAYGLAHRRKA